MKTAFIFHGTAGHPGENWFPWLKAELEKLDYQVIVPQFPTPENQTLENWFKVFENYEKLYSAETIVVGHSLGGAFLLRVLQKYSNIKVKLAAFVGTPIGVLPIKNYDGDKLFIKDPFDWEKIKNAAQNFLIFHSDNDPYVCLGNGEKLAENLETKLNFIPGAGHFNQTAGYLKFEELLKEIHAFKNF